VINLHRAITEKKLDLIYQPKPIMLKVRSTTTTTTTATATTPKPTTPSPTTIDQPNWPTENRDIACARSGHHQG